MIGLLTAFQDWISCSSLYITEWSEVEWSPIYEWTFETYSVRHEFNKSRGFVLDDKLPSRLDSVDHSEDIVAIDTIGLNWVSKCPLSNSITSELIISGSRNGPFVISAQKQSLALQSLGEVESRVEIAFGGGAFAEKCGRNPIFIADPETVPGARGLRYLGS